MGTVAEIWRHPIKSHGREKVDRVVLTKGQTLPHDRSWAVAFDASKADGSEWVRCANFSRCSKTPSLQAMRLETHGDGKMTATHPELETLTFDPSTEGKAFVEWSKALSDPSRAAQPDRLLRSASTGMTDSAYPTISLINLSSHNELARAAGRPVSPLRWRGNLLIDGLEPWEEFDWVGKVVQVGSARLAIRERTERCNATRGNPETGETDLDTLALLNDNWSHQDFGVYAEVVETGEVKTGDKLELI